jgi:oxygen-independent coproporphyrinogen-3 oxidase
MTSTPATVSFYIHIPFCRTKCTYCAFNAYANLDALVEPFVDALVREIEILGANKPGQTIGTIFFGGGTPSLLTPAQVERILDTISRFFDVLPDAEISLEANPNDLDTPYLKALRGAGVNRLSIGMQSANANEMTLFARRHDNDGVARAVSTARQAGFENVNLDLIYGFPHQTLESWRISLNQMLALQPEHVSLYALGLEDGTPMKDWVNRGRLPTPDDDLAADMYDLATDLLDAGGYEQYEISNWSKPDRACRHNLQYWRNLPYVGVGPGAHGYADGVRYSTVLSPQRYIQAMQKAETRFEFPRTPATLEAVLVDRDNEIAETLITGLRLTQEGIEREAFQRRFGADLLDIHGGTIQRYQQYGLLYADDEVVRLTAEGRLLSNVIFRELV